ncbi:MAG TPA: RNA-binding domain-containing protein [Thermomicrobiales bacterium]|nr:RNA-binding domain-containing protein [Thermomicrobiales bacterium]
MGRSRRSRASDRGQRDQHELVWRRIDLHIHTPASADYQEPDCSFLDILRKAESRGADLIAFTDHNSVRGYANFWREIEDLELLEVLERLTPGEQRRLDEYRRLLRSIRVLPGFELTATFGFHITAIFPEGTSIRQLEHLLLELNVPEDKIDFGSGEVGATTDVLRAYEILHDAGALVIPAHVNSTHGVAMTNLPFGGQTKIAFTQSEYIHALEATDMESTSRRSTARFFNGSKPEYPKRMHIIQGSDAHRLNRDPNRPSNLGVCDRMTEVQLEEPTFAALRELFESDNFNRIRPYRPSHDPYDFVRIARAEGETIVQAFHDTLPPRRGRLSPVVRDAAAFANGNGGTIFVGLSANTRDPIAGIDDAPETARAIAEDLARYVTPPIAGTIDITATEDKQIIVIQVPAGSDKPYAVLPSTIFVRQEGETTVALRDEIVQLVRAGVAETTGTLPELVPTGQPVAPIVPRRRPVEIPAFDDEVLEPTTEQEPPVAAADGSIASERTAPRSSRRRRGSGRTHATEQPTSDATSAPEPSAIVTESDGSIQLSEADAPQLHACEDIPFPRTGVEIVESTLLDGVRYHAMRDLRNLKVVQNVTRDSARRLWRYAITQLEMHPCREEDVTWDGVTNRGYWKSYKPRGGDVRYNLVYRHDDHLHVFYGVTDEGIDDEWRNVLPAHLAERQLVNGQANQLEDVALTPEAAEPSDVIINEQPHAFLPFGEVAAPAVQTPPSAPEPANMIANAPDADVIAPEPEAAIVEEPPAPTRTRRTRSRKPKAAELEPVGADIAETAAPEAPAVAPSVEAVAAAEPVVPDQPIDEPAPKPKRTRAPRTRKAVVEAERPAEPAAAEEEVKPTTPRRRTTRSKAAATEATTPEATLPDSVAPEANASEAAADEPPKPKRTRRTTTPRKKTDAAETGETPNPSSPEQEGA